MICCVLLTPACEYLWDHDNAPSPECNLDHPFRLWYGQSADCEALKVTFTGDIQDSRCPTSVTCVWEGRVDVQIQVDDELITLGLPDDPQLGQSKDTVGNHVIELLQVLPVPVVAGEIPKDTYRVKLQVSEL